MKKLKTIALVITVCTFFSCTKTESNNTVSLTDFVKTISVTDGSVTYKDEIFYDSQGRIDSINKENGYGRFIYKYPTTNKIIGQLIRNSNNELQIYIEVYLNSSNLQDSAFQYNNTKDSSSEKCVYNAQGQLINFKRYRIKNKVTTHIISETVYEYNPSGNVIRETTTYHGGTTPVITNYTYTNTPFVFKYGTLYPYPYQIPNHLVLRKTVAGTFTQTSDYSYTFDNKNRVSTEKEVRNSSVSIVTNYTYY
ncbi:MAG: hypothetical protein ACOVMM_12065 [Chitinophagaceae bacterium]